jgi:hypothetical protein
MSSIRFPRLQTLLKAGFQDNVGTHILSGLGAGFIAVCVGSPVDVVRPPPDRVLGPAEHRRLCPWSSFSGTGLAHSLLLCVIGSAGEVMTLI